MTKKEKAIVRELIEAHLALRIDWRWQDEKKKRFDEALRDAMSLVADYASSYPARSI